MQFSRAHRQPCCAVAAGLILLILSGGARVATSQSQPAPARATDDRWWKREPIRFLQTNLSETDSTVDPKALVAAVAGVGANTFLMNMGGIVAQYPTKVPFHYASSFLPRGRDLFGDVIREAHARKIRVIGRFDLSKTQRAVFDAHPEWFFRRATGEPVIYNGLYSTCINGNYYREHALTILSAIQPRTTAVCRPVRASARLVRPAIAPDTGGRYLPPPTPITERSWRIRRERSPRRSPS